MDNKSKGLLVIGGVIAAAGIGIAVASGKASGGTGGGGGGGGGTYALTITVSPTGGGTATGAGSYAAGTNVTVTATPASGYTFTGWVSASGATVSSSTSYSFTLDANTTLTAKFTQQSTGPSLVCVVVKYSDFSAISGATVKLSGPINKILVTDSTGIVTFTNLTDGNYTVDVSASGYISLTGIPVDVTKDIQYYSTFELVPG
jgi:uncharacterized repeat protein (TIGR02543 family)